jgi:hypothetical protein
VWYFFPDNSLLTASLPAGGGSNSIFFLPVHAGSMIARITAAKTDFMVLELGESLRL